MVKGIEINEKYSSPVLTGKGNIILRPFKLEDAEALYLLRSDPSTNVYTDDKAFENKNAAAIFIRKVLENVPGPIHYLAIEIPGEVVFAGYCRLKDLGEGQADIGIRVTKNMRRKGFATNAVELLILWAFKESGYKVVKAKTVTENRASVRVLEKIGMKFVRNFEAHGYLCAEYELNSPESINPANQK